MKKGRRKKHVSTSEPTARRDLAERSERPDLVDRSEPDTLKSLQAWLTESRSTFIIIASTVIVYSNSLSGRFVFDDTKQIVSNSDLRSLANLLHAFTRDVWSFQKGTVSSGLALPYYRPLFTTYLTLNYQLFGLWEPGWHLANLAVHAGATVLVYFLVKRLRPGEER